MIANDLSTLYGFMGFVFLFAFIAAIFVNVLTRDYNDKLHNLYSLFMDISKKNMLIETIILLNFSVLFYYSIYNNNYGNVPIYLIVIATTISSFVAFNFRIIISNIVYSSISCALLWLLAQLNNYLKYVVYNSNVAILKVLFVVMMIIFAFLMLVRQTELLIDNRRRNL